jgi:signal peptidase I
MLQSSPARNRRVLIQSLVALSFLTICGVLRIFVYEIALITSESMEPTFGKGDYLLVNHAPKNEWSRGEIVFFKNPDSWSDDGQDILLVKRIIGLPGETIKYSLGQVSINGKRLSEPYLKETESPDDARPVRLGPNQYYVLGDNRDNSDDSRINGPIEAKDVRSSAVGLVFPFAAFKWFSLPRY